VLAAACVPARAREAPGAAASIGAAPSRSASPSAAARTPEPRPRSRSVYEAITSPRLSPRVARIRPEVYVPNNDSNTVDVIDPRTFRVVRSFPVGAGPQHVTPSWNLRWLYVGNTYANTLTVIDPRTAGPVRTIDVPDPYNLYFTPDGRLAVDVAERMSTLFLYRMPGWRPAGEVSIPWAGADHLDFSRSGRYLLLSTEFAGRVVRVNLARRRVTGSLDVGGSPVDVKLAPDGRVFFVANQLRGGVSVVDPRRMREIAFIRTGGGAHGMAVSRDGRSLYVSDRLAGSISVIDFATRRVVHTWRVGGSPDMLQVSADGRLLWASNRYDGTVSVISTRTGRVLHTIAVGSSPHGLTLFPQPGRFSVGHNGVYR
jgi:YVTN family beta-propeller protein